MTEQHGQPTSPHGTDRWGEPVFGDGITTGSYVFMPQPGQGPGERDVFQVAFVGGRPGARDELVAFGWRCDAATGEWEPYWQSVGPSSVPSILAEAQPTTNPESSEIQVWPLKRVLAEVRCGSEDWTWEEEWADLDRRHADTGYLTKLEEVIRENGITMPVLVGSDGRLWDGHHRLRLAVRLGIGYVPVEVVPPAAEAPTTTEPEPESCVHCGKTIRCISGTLAQWWVHEPGGHTVCFPEQAASSSRATPKPAAGPQPGERPIVGYSGMGRVWCLACPRPDGEDVPVTVDILQPYEECAGCRRDVVDVARTVQQDGTQSG